MGFNRSKYCLIWFISVRQSAREEKLTFEGCF